ncbi:hypothetical protein [Mesorhizobium sp. M7A.F.Ca.MR.176.00.0.0]|uniref:hypothetical protein n=1 Tax=Mesorhizobium sp. M7A.F.Ca.MR.176.00.0.0 TaxID=2496776 RepID=UPI0032B2B080
MASLSLVCWSVAALAAIVPSLALTPTLYAHKAQSGFEYPASCCNGDKSVGDCQMISDDIVRETPEGCAVVLLPGDHRLVTRRQSFRIPYGQQLNSPDGTSSAYIQTKPSSFAFSLRQDQGDSGSGCFAPPSGR